MLTIIRSQGLGSEVGGWLIIHGATELFACVLAAAAGFRIGWAVMFPGARSRLDAAMVGVVVMLLIAGILEGIGRQLIQIDLARYAIGIGMLTLWLAYFYVPRPGSRR